MTARLNIYIVLACYKLLTSDHMSVMMFDFPSIQSYCDGESMAAEWCNNVLVCCFDTCSSDWSSMLAMH